MPPLTDPVAQFPAATVACFDPTRGELPRRALDRAATGRFLERLAAGGARSLLIGASTGQGHLRTPEELEEWFAVAAEAEIGDAWRMALLRPEDGLERNRQLLRALRRGRYHAVFFRPGNHLPPNASEEQIVASLQPLIAAAAELELPVGLYSIPDVSGVRLTAAAAARLRELPGGEAIVACKITEAEYETSTAEYLREPGLAGLKIVQGWDPHLARALRDGGEGEPAGRNRCGVTSGPMSFALFQYLHLLEAAERGDWSEVEEAQRGVTTLFQAMQEDPARFADLQRAKYLMGLGHPLTGEVTATQAERVLAALRGLPRSADRRRLARSLDLLGQGPAHEELAALAAEG